MGSVPVIAVRQPASAGRFRVSRWRAKCFRPCEVNTIDYLTHPVQMIRAIVRGWRPRHPAHLTLKASHLPATGVGPRPAAMPAQVQARITLLLVSAHLFQSPSDCPAYHRIRASAIGPGSTVRRRAPLTCSRPGAPLMRIPCGGPAATADTFPSLASGSLPVMQRLKMAGRGRGARFAVRRVPSSLFRWVSRRVRVDNLACSCHRRKNQLMAGQDGPWPGRPAGFRLVVWWRLTTGPGRPSGPRLAKRSARRPERFAGRREARSCGRRSRRRTGRTRSRSW